MLLSRSSVIANTEVDFKQNIEMVAKLRERVDQSIPYLYADSAYKSSADAEYKHLIKRYIERAIQVLGEDRVKELISNGQLPI